jgi:hypothetical protein
MVSLLRLKGNGGQAGVSVQVSDNREQRSDYRRQKTVCLLSSFLCFLCSVLFIFLTPDTRNLTSNYS